MFVLKERVEMNKSTLLQEFSIMEVSQSYFRYLNVQIQIFFLSATSKILIYKLWGGAQVLHFRTLQGIQTGILGGKHWHVVAGFANS